MRRQAIISLFFLGTFSSIHAFVVGIMTKSPISSSFSSSSSSSHFPRTNAVPLLFLSAIGEGDTVVVVGGSGGVGQLVSRKLAQAGYFVRVTSRNNPSTTDTNPNLTSTKLDLVKGSDQELQQAIQGAAALVISVGTTAFPTLKWKGGNTPQAIDDIAVTRLAYAASALQSLKRIVLVTSIGVDRTDQMPFFILNLFGVLDAKKKGEEAVRKAANENIDYAIIRPGRLIGGPFTNLDVAKLLQLKGGAENGVTVAAGDVLLGDCKRDACAEAIVQCLTNAACSNVEFSIVSNENETAWSVEQWTSAFQRM
ncbi:hypothetical protein FisN_6Lh069 [Fistulifera solaris]|uniref:NAD(P)-binding domain-containing protein n=1 Tax=Fistulifera solaris TaxID=1519565 RepID=A0A1Z5KP62_FISSO|nr:hypothetical protein FisN_6Lh069 [Fistulifera solaris]|eukprot:GAX28114.1 hypothetical protein FisN_6Lh069 [Fistulifera solaris]